jgi:murein DD-endopeptidase MepM/ murein hydrolase activator NlpD
MFRKYKEITFYYADHLLQIRKIRWVRLKIIGIAATSVALCIGLLLTANYLCNNFLGIGNNRLQVLIQENRLLHEQLAAITQQLNQVENSVSRLSDQGNQLRLMVDLSTVDEQTQHAGTGGSVLESELDFGSDSSLQLLSMTKKLLRSLSSEVKVQEQSYGQIVNKYEFNKGYFTALPAIKPMSGFYSTKEFGVRMHPVLGIKKIHEGLDIVNDVGTQVVATGDGVVQLAGHTGGGFGYAIVINHGYGYQTVYAHLLKILVREGQHVKRGNLIAKSGRSGLVSGPHLHYEVRHNGISQNPMDYFFDDVSIGEYRQQIALR